MAKPLIVELQGQSFDLVLEKVDRTKLYGYIETEILDESGKRCELGTLTSDGHSIVSKGGTALAYLSQDGLWKKKAELKPVDIEGRVIAPVKSSFDAPVVLDKKATIDDYLSHNIQSVYRISVDDPESGLMNELRGGAIFQFPYSFRGGVEASVGFLLLGADGNPFLCVGIPTALDYVGLKATAAVISEVDETADEDEALDFSLV